MTTNEEDAVNPLYVHGQEAPVAVTVTEQEIAAAFTEWERRYREEPERFEAEARRLLHSTPETYGEACAPYLLALLRGDA